MIKDFQIYDTKKGRVYCTGHVVIAICDTQQAAADIAGPLVGDKPPRRTSATATPRHDTELMSELDDLIAHLQWLRTRC